MQFGGFNPCSEDIGYILPTLRNKLRTLVKQGNTPEYINNVMNVFNECYDFLLGIYFDDKLYTQEFTDNHNNVFYKSIPQPKLHLNYIALALVFY
jgi:hypothetical protein